jgi:hypothetical protein
MLNKQRFFKFGLDLQLEEVDPPKDMSMWAGKPSFVEENVETVLSFNLATLLPEERWLVIGRQESNFPDPDLTATSKACDLVFIEIKKDRATSAMADQNLGYWIRTRPEGYPYYLSRYLGLQCNREWVEPIRLLGLAKGSTLDKSGPVRARNLERLEKYNDTLLSDEQFLALARGLLREGVWRPLSEIQNHRSALLEAFRRRFGFGDHELLRTRLGKSVNLAFVAPTFSQEFLRKVRTLWDLGVFSSLLQAELHRHESDAHSFLLSFTHLVSDAVMAQGLYEKRRFLGFLKEELLELEGRGLESGRRPLRIPLHMWGWYFPGHNREALRFHPRVVGHYGEIDLKNLKVTWLLEWMNMGVRAGIVSRIQERLRRPETELPPGIQSVGRLGRQEMELESPENFNRAAARDMAESIYSFFRYTFDLYDSCGLWDDPYDAFARPT